MVCIECSLHGKRVHKLAKPTKEEYVFVSSGSAVFPQDCKKCKEPDCPHNFNDKKLLKNKGLRKQLLDWVFDATLDDLFLEHGLVIIRDTPTVKNFNGEVYSKPCFNNIRGEDLLEMDEIICKMRDEYRRSLISFSVLLKSLIPNKPRIIIKRKE